MRTRHKYIITIAQRTRPDQLYDAIATARRKAFSGLADVLPAGAAVHLVYREINRIIDGGMREIGAEIYISDQPFDAATVAQLTRPDWAIDMPNDADLDNGAEAPIELREGN